MKVPNEKHDIVRLLLTLFHYICKRVLILYWELYLQYMMISVSSLDSSFSSVSLDFACWAWPTLVPHSDDYWAKPSGYSCEAHLD